MALDCFKVRNDSIAAGEPGQEDGPYFVQAVLRACDLLQAFHFQGETLRLRDLVARTDLNKATAHRLLVTLEQRGFVEREGQNLWRSRIRLPRAGRYRLGYAQLNSASEFSREVTESLIRAARDENIDLLTLDNRYNLKTAVRNAETLVREKPDLIIDFQIDEKAAPIVASKFLEAGIPFIAMGTPHPGGTFFGIDNYRAGQIGGRCLGKWARHHWGGNVDELVLVDMARAGPLTRSRLAGILEGVREFVPGLSDAHVVHLDGDGQFAASLVAVRKHLRCSRAGRALIGGINDPSALGAIRAFEEAGRAPHCAAIGMDASLAGRTELRRPEGRMIGSVAFFPENYGPELIRLAIDVLSHKNVPPAVFGRHQLITRESVNRFYPNDAILNTAALENLLLQSPRRAT